MPVRTGLGPVRAVARACSVSTVCKFVFAGFMIESLSRPADVCPGWVVRGGRLVDRSARTEGRAGALEIVREAVLSSRSTGTENCTKAGLSGRSTGTEK